MNPADLRLAYLVVSQPTPGFVLGGVMVIDGFGLPVDFRYSEPLEPSRMQQILYGSVLTRYLKHHVLLGGALEGLEAHVLLVEDDAFLSPVGDGASSLKLPNGLWMLRLSEGRKGLGEGEKQPVTSVSPYECVITVPSETTSFRVQAPPCQPLPHIQDVNTPPEPLSWLIDTGSRTPLLEPFQRVQRALVALGEEEGFWPAKAGAAAASMS